eukprot:CCRYP_013235-RA/>CCRYP_013235-RA protein AED:0.41 eAED:0.41 QI:20/1/1/1/0/0/2/22/62
MSRSGFEGWRAWTRDGGHGWRRFLAETKCAEGALLLELGFKKLLMVLCPGRRVFSAHRVVQC